MTVDHVNGDKTDNRLANLEYVSRAENSRRHQLSDRSIHPRGSAHWNAKLTEAAILEIRRLKEGGMSSRRIGEMLGVSGGTIQAVWEGRSWTHV